MGTKKCNACYVIVNSSEKVCPNCGAVIKKRLSCLGCFGLIFCSFFGFIFLCSLLLSNDSPVSRPTNQAERILAQKKEEVRSTHVFPPSLVK